MIETRKRRRPGFWRDFRHAHALARDMVPGCYHPDLIAEEVERIDLFFQELKKELTAKK